MSKYGGWFFQIFGPSHNIWPLEIYGKLAYLNKKHIEKKLDGTMCYIFE